MEMSILFYFFYAMGAADNEKKAKLLHRSYRYGNLSHLVKLAIQKNWRRNKWIQEQFDPYSSIYDLRSRGVFFVSTTDGQRAHFHFGCWTTQCSHEPPRMLTCFPKEFEGTEIVKRSGVWALSMVAEDQEIMTDHFFSGDQTIETIGKEKFMYAETGCPILKDAVYQGNYCSARRLKAR
jgi:hypothetical protein